MPLNMKKSAFYGAMWSASQNYKLAAGTVTPSLALAKRAGQVAVMC
jgi:hypothetical protein